MRKWAKKRQIKFNLDKCETTYFEKLNQTSTHGVNDWALGWCCFRTERRWGTSLLNVVTQVDKMVKTVNAMVAGASGTDLGSYVITVPDVNETTPGILCAVLVIMLTKDAIKLQRVQNRFTSMLLGPEGFNYKEG